MRNRGRYRDLDAEQKQALKRIAVVPALQPYSKLNWPVPCALGGACEEHALLESDQGSLPKTLMRPCSSACRCSSRSWTSFPSVRTAYQIHIGSGPAPSFARSRRLIGDVLYCSCMYLSSEGENAKFLMNQGTAIYHRNIFSPCFYKSG